MTYSVQPADVATLATADGTPALEYFSNPLPNTALTASALLSELTITSPDVLDGCARACLSDQACLSFATDGTTSCELYLAVQSSENTLIQIGKSYYEKNLDEVSTCRLHALMFESKASAYVYFT